MGAADEAVRIVQIDEPADQVDARRLPGLDALALEQGDQFVPAAGWSLDGRSAVAAGLTRPRV